MTTRFWNHSSDQSGYRALVIGASTGGPKVLREILESFPDDLPVPIFLVQHISPTFTTDFAEWLDRNTALSVKVAEEDEPYLHGTVYVAPANRHLVINGRRLRLLDSEERNFHRPSVDMLFESAADHFGRSVVGILLTGMGNDGAEGSKKIIERGGYTLVQDEESSAVFGMPFASIKAGGAGEVLDYRIMAKRILELLFIDLDGQ